MKGRAFIDILRACITNIIVNRDESILLADAVEEADRSHRQLIEYESQLCGGMWWDMSASVYKDQLGVAIFYLSRRGLIKRKDGEPHMVRFVDE